MFGEQTAVVSNSYAMYYSVRSSLRKTVKDFRVNLIDKQIVITTITLMIKVQNQAEKLLLKPRKQGFSNS